eukprot:426717-Amphidinium_carterae.1
MLARVLDAVILYYGLSALGMRLNPFKQLISREWAEYVRRIVTKNKLLAFTNRAIGNHLVPPVQMSEVADTLAKVAAWYGQINEISLRGAAPGAVDAFHYNMLREATYERAVDRIPDAYLYTPVENQGFEFHTLGHIGMAFSQVELPRWPVVSEHFEHAFHDYHNYASSDLAQLIVPKVRAAELTSWIQVDRMSDDKTKNDLQSSAPIGIRRSCYAQLLREHDFEFEEVRFLLTRRSDTLIGGELCVRDSGSARSRELTTALAAKYLPKAVKSETKWRTKKRRKVIVGREHESPDETKVLNTTDISRVDIQYSRRRFSPI